MINRVEDSIGSRWQNYGTTMLREERFVGKTSSLRSTRRWQCDKVSDGASSQAANVNLECMGQQDECWYTRM